MRSNIFLKIQKAASSPLKLKRFVLLIVNSKLSLFYDWVMFVLDRSISIVLVLIYDMGGFLRKGNKQYIEVLGCFHAYHHADGSQISMERLFFENTLVDYIKDPERVSFHHWDDNQPLLGIGFSFYKKVMSLTPKYLVLSSYNQNTFYYPMPWILARLKQRNIRTIALWVDTCSGDFVEQLLSVMDLFDFHGVMDNPTLDFGGLFDDRLKGKVKAVFPPYEIEVEEKERNIDIAFFGTVSSYRDFRKPYLDFLVDGGVDLYCSTSEREQWISYEKYYEILSRSKIGLNFSMSTERHQLKGRVPEVMFAGGLLMEEKNEQTASIFSEGEDYVAFSSKEELLEKVRYYLEHEEERDKIAKSGQRKARQLFNGKRFWGDVLNS